MCGYVVGVYPWSGGTGLEWDWVFVYNLEQGSIVYSAQEKYSETGGTEPERPKKEKERDPLVA